MAEERDHYILRRMKEDREQVEKILDHQNKALNTQVGGSHYKEIGRAHV